MVSEYLALTGVNHSMDINIKEVHGEPRLHVSVNLCRSKSRSVFFFRIVTVKMVIIYLITESEVVTGKSQSEALL